MFKKLFKGSKPGKPGDVVGQKRIKSKKSKHPVLELSRLAK